MENGEIKKEEAPEMNSASKMLLEKNSAEVSNASLANKKRKRSSTVVQCDLNGKVIKIFCKIAS